MNIISEIIGKYDSIINMMYASRNSTILKIVSMKFDNMQQ